MRSTPLASRARARALAAAARERAGGAPACLRARACSYLAYTRAYWPAADAGGPQLTRPRRAHNDPAASRARQRARATSAWRRSRPWTSRRRPLCRPRPWSSLRLRCACPGGMRLGPGRARGVQLRAWVRQRAAATRARAGARRASSPPTCPARHARAPSRPTLRAANAPLSKPPPASVRLPWPKKRDWVSVAYEKVVDTAEDVLLMARRGAEAPARWVEGAVMCHGGVWQRASEQCSRQRSRSPGQWASAPKSGWLRRPGPRPPGLLQTCPQERDRPTGPPEGRTPEAEQAGQARGAGAGHWLGGPLTLQGAAAGYARGLGASHRVCVSTLLAAVEHVARDKTRTCSRACAPRACTGHRHRSVRGRVRVAAQPLHLHAHAALHRCW